MSNTMYHEKCKQNNLAKIGARVVLSLLSIVFMSSSGCKKEESKDKDKDKEKSNEPTSNVVAPTSNVVAPTSKASEIMTLRDRIGGWIGEKKDFRAEFPNEFDNIASAIESLKTACYSTDPVHGDWVGEPILNAYDNLLPFMKGVMRGGFEEFSRIVKKDVKKTMETVVKSSDASTKFTKIIPLFDIGVLSIYGKAALVLFLDEVSSLCKACNKIVDISERDGKHDKVAMTNAIAKFERVWDNLLTLKFYFDSDEGLDFKIRPLKTFKLGTGAENRMESTPPSPATPAVVGPNGAVTTPAKLAELGSPSPNKGTGTEDSSTLNALQSSIGQVINHMTDLNEEWAKLLPSN